MSERIEDLFDRYVDRLVLGDGASLPVVDTPDHEEDPELAELLGSLLQTGELVATQLKTVQPDPRFRIAARVRMRNLFFARLARREQRPGLLALWWQQRWASALATGMVVCLASLGVLAASFNALPSGFFYPVKVTTEEVRLSLTTSEYERAQLRVEFAERRLAEMTSMADRGDAETAVLLAGEATRIVVQMAASGVFDLSDAQSGQLALVPGTSAAGLSPVAVLTADRDETLSLLATVLESAPEELKPDIQHLITAMAAEFDATITNLEEHTTG